MKRYAPVFYHLALANLLFFLGNSLFILLPVYLKNLGATESYIGVVNNIDKLFAIATALGMGALMRGRDRVTLLRLGYLVITIAYLAYLSVETLAWYLPLIRVVHGIGFSLAMIVGTTMVFDIVPREDAATAIGIFGVTGALSNAVSPFAGEQLLAAGLPHSLIFLLSGILGALALTVSLVMPRPAAVIPFTDGMHPDGGGGLRRNGRFIILGIVTVVFGGSFGVIVTYLPNFIRSTTPFNFSLFFMIYIGVLIVIRLTFMSIVTRVNRGRLIAAVLATGALMMLTLNILHSMIVLVLVSVMYGITHGVLYPVLNATMVGVVPTGERAKANALFTACFNGGMMVFALGLGFAIDTTGTYLVAFNVCAPLFAGAAVLVALTDRLLGGLDVAPRPEAGAPPPADSDIA